MTTERLRITPEGGPDLEARWDRPDRPALAVVFCHPHPQQGGTMTAPLMHKVTKRLVERGAAVLRFNYRGVGQSDGSWGGGIGEVDDVAAAVSVAKESGLPLGLAGWSFGAGVALTWQVQSGDTTPYAGIAPAVSLAPSPASLLPARRRFLLGDRDQFVTVEEMQAYGDALESEVVVMKGSDHFFYFREDKVGDFVWETFEL